uniref:CCHC-type domain-containing protein n=1 Tax=Fagus sylvatica TaxID=28930 RepID=A0A2N9J6I9_FAGSY
MSSFSPLATILNQNKLTGPNYVDWKRNLDIVLIAKEHKYVLTQPCLDFPNPDTSLDERNRYNRWHKSNDMAKCYIMASIFNVLQHQMQDITLASDIMLSLKEMFGIQAEGILKTKGTVNLTQASTSKPKSKGKGGWKKKKKVDQKGKQVALRVAKGSTQAGNSKPKGKCFHCGEDGHWKRNCLKFLASKKQGMFKSLLQGFKETKKLSDEVGIVTGQIETRSWVTLPALHWYYQYPTPPHPGGWGNLPCSAPEPPRESGYRALTRPTPTR